MAYSKHLGEQPTDAVRYVVGDFFPTGEDVPEAENWTGLRPMAPVAAPLSAARCSTIYF